MTGPKRVTEEQLAATRAELHDQRTEGVEL